MNGDDRPDPDRLLAAAREADAPARGRLVVWLGAVAGVGKTCAMLDAAHEARAAGRDVVVGLVEHHGRADTLRRLDGLEVLPRRPTPAGYPPEFDLDAVLARRPEVVVVDELAHDNAPGGRHPKRWQDVRELVAAGLEVWTAVNVQHLERTADVVARLTGVAVRETVPDAVVDEADEIEVVDLPPDALIARLEEGKVYGPDATARALRGFFRRGNLLALRELALRRAAERAGEDVDEFRDAAAMPEVWSASDRLLVAVGPSPLSARVVRIAARLARALDAPWHAVVVRTPGLGGEALQAANAHLALAESLGAEVATVESDTVPAALVGYARAQNLRTIVLGASPRSNWLALWRPPLVDAVAREATDLELYVVPARDGEQTVAVPRPRWAVSGRDLGLGVALVGAATALGWTLRGVLPETDLLMFYLLAVVVASFRLSRGAALATALGAVAAFNFFFTEPRFTFYVDEQRYLLTFAGFAGLGTLVSALASRARDRAEVAARRELEARTLYRLGRALSEAADADAVAREALVQVGELFGAPGVVRLGPPEALRVAARTIPEPSAPEEEATARWAADHVAPVGPGTDTLPDVAILQIPLRAGGRVHGVLGVRVDRALLDDPDRRHLLHTVVDQLGAALARDALARGERESSRRADREQTRSSLLASVSHDLRTPLATITGAATTMQGGGLDAPAQHRLLTQIVDESHRLAGMVDNLLHMTRLEADVDVTLDWQVAQDLAGSAVARVEPRAAPRPITVSAPEGPALVLCDALLVEQALVNLLENALRHAPGPEPVEVTVQADDAEVRFLVEDRGPGVPAGEAVFAPFVRGAGAGRGSGLGLAIVQAVARVHGGTATVAPRPGGGSTVALLLPAGGPDRATPPALDEP